MFKKYLKVFVGLSLLVGCASSTDIKNTLKNNPEILADTMRENPELFMQALTDLSISAQRMEQKRRLEELNKAMALPKNPQIDASRVLYGNAKAPVMIVKYGDFQCPACRAGFRSLNEVKKKYGNKVAVIYKNVPLEQIHPLAKEAAMIFESLMIVSKKKAREFYQKAYDQQRLWKTKSELWSVAKSVGAKKSWIQKYRTKILSRIAEDVSEHQKFGFRGTPAYVVGGVGMYGAQSPADLSAVIDKVLKKKR